MKLRIMGDSIRLRLTQGEVQALKEAGRAGDQVRFGPDADDALAYEIVAPAHAREIAVRWAPGRLTVELPAPQAAEWADGEQVGLEAFHPLPEGQLRIQIQKDFTCLIPRKGEEDRDTFPNPAAVHEDGRTGPGR